MRQSHIAVSLASAGRCTDFSRCVVMAYLGE